MFKAEPGKFYVEEELVDSMVHVEYDPVEKPEHYNAGQIETIDYIVDVLGDYETVFYCHGNILKYLGSRLWNKDNPIQDAKKARWYLDKMIEQMEKTKGINW